MNDSTPIPIQPAARSRGFTLVEVLVALVVLSIGLLGIAALQITSKRGNYEAMQHSLATQYADGILERMRSNPDVLGQYTDGGGGRTIDLRGGSFDLSGWDETETCAGGCTATQIAMYDLTQWLNTILGTAETDSGANVGGLFQPVTCIAGPNGGAGVYSIAIAWRGMEAVADPYTGSGTIDECGQSGADYDLAAGNSFRRFIVVNAFITPI